MHVIWFLFAQLKRGWCDFVCQVWLLKGRKDYEYELYFPLQRTSRIALEFEEVAVDVLCLQILTSSSQISFFHQQFLITVQGFFYRKREGSKNGKSRTRKEA